jgi:hypothetical protein
VPRSTAVTDEHDEPVEISSGRPASASSTALCLRQLQPDLRPTMQPVPELQHITLKLGHVVAQAVLQGHFSPQSWSPARPAGGFGQRTNSALDS